MKNINKTLVLIGIVLLCNASYAQRSDWTLGFRMGYKIQMLEKTTLLDLKIQSVQSDLKPIGRFYVVNYPTVELNVTYTINERFFISSGFAYLEYIAAWGKEEYDWNKKEWLGSVGGAIDFRYLQIPLNLKYAIPLGKSNFSVYGKLGFSFDILVDLLSYGRDNGKILHYEKGSEPFSDIILLYDGFFEFSYKQTKIFDKKMNVLLNAGIGFGYRFKNGWGLSLEGAYYAGLRTMGHVFIEVTPMAYFPGNSKDYSEHLLIRGNYWNFSLGISYNFKKKEVKRSDNL